MILDGYTLRSVHPYAEPISLAQAKRQLRVDGTDDDTYITALIGAARDYVENSTNCQLVLASFEQQLDEFPCHRLFCLDYPPLRKVTSIAYTDANGTAQTLSTSIYAVDTGMLPGQVSLTYGHVWPPTRCVPNAVTVSFQAGYAIPFTAATNDTITFYGYQPTNGERYRLSATDGVLPGGLSFTQDYYVINASGYTCNFSTTSGGSAVDITSVGTTGTFFAGVIPPAAIHAMLLLISWMYDNRSANIDANKIPPQINWALSSIKWGAY